MKKITVFLVALVLVMGQVGILCATPISDTNTRPVVVGPAAGGELSLQTILNNTFGVGAINAATDQQTEAYFTTAGIPPGGAQVFPVLVAEFSGNATNQTFGIFGGNDTTAITTAQVFGGANVPFNTAQIVWDTATTGNITLGAVVTPFSGIAYNDFGFYYGFGTGTQTILFSADSANAGNQAGILAYKTPSGAAWAFACDDQVVDADYNDMVIKVESINPVPLPPSVLLMGSGLLGLGFLRFRRKNAA